MKHLSEYQQFEALRQHVPLVLEEFKKAALTWFDWNSDAVDAQGNCVFLDGGWTVSPLYFDKKSPDDVLEIEDEALMAEVRSLCGTLPLMFPQTTALLQDIPSINYAAFSRLGPRSQLVSHRHLSPGSLIMHMGLQIPRHCGIVVKGVTEHVWRLPGDVFIFDDNLEHSAWNFSTGERILLYVDFERGSDE